MKKIFLLITLNFVIILILLLLIPSIFIKIRQGTSQTEGSNTIPLTKNKPITFSFISNLPDLESILIDFKNPNLNNKSSIELKVSNGNDERNLSFSGNNIGDPDTIPLKFPHFNTPSNTKYFVTLTTENIDNSSLYVVTNSQNIPKFKSKYSQPNFTHNIKYNFDYQLNRFRERSYIHNLIYIGIILMLNYLIFHKSDKSN